MSAPRFQLVSGPDNLMDYPEGATQTFKRGDIVKLSSSLVVITTGTPIGDNVLLGVAAADASGVTSADVPVYVFTPSQIWQTFPPTGTAPSSLTLGADYEIDQTTIGVGEMATGTTTTTCVLYSRKAMGKDGTTAGDPILIKIEQDNLPEVGL